MDDNLMDMSSMDLDLNQEPMDPPLSSIGRRIIEERIRQLEGVSERARQRQRRRQERNSTEISHYPSGERSIVDGISNMGMIERTPEKGKGCKRDSSHLVARALEMDSMVKKDDKDKDGGSFYDCNICLDMAREPVLTCCGHLFCWSCFYQVSGIDSTSKECPVCKGEVSDSTVIPIYGNGGNERVCETKSGFIVPPRPKALRVESVRQQRMNHGVPHVPVAEALRRIRISIGEVDHQTQQEGGGGVRVLSESADSLSSLSSALSNAEILVEDLETVINNQLSRNDSQVLPVDFRNPFTRNQPQDSTQDINAALPITSSSQSTDVSGSSVHSMTTRTSREISLPMAPPYSLRRRSILPRTSDVDSRHTRERRRRRLN